MSFNSAEWTIPELCAWITARNVDAINGLSEPERHSLRGADTAVPGAWAARDAVLGAAQNSQISVSSGKPIGPGDVRSLSDALLVPRLMLDAAFWKRAELTDQEGRSGECVARLTRGMLGTWYHYELRVSRYDALRTWPQEVRLAGEMIRQSPGEILRPSQLASIKKSTVLDSLVEWLKRDGSVYRNRPDAIIRAEYKAAHRHNAHWTISKELIRNARQNLGLSHRVKGQHK